MAASAAVLAWSSGCGPAIRPDFNSPEPAARNMAIVRAGDARDAGATRDLVRMLASDDPATRLLAIEALDRVTGERLGYDASDPPERRREALDRWGAWVRAREAGANE